jgi:hypothetical protein
MPFNLTWAERQIFLNHAWGPGPMLDMFAALGFKAVCAAVKLNLFEVLESGGPQTAEEVALEIRADERGVRLLLDALWGVGYVVRTRKSRYVNSPMTRSWMLAGSPVNLGAMLGFFEDACERWSQLDVSIRNGAPAEPCNAWLDRHRGAWERYHANLHGVAELLSGEIVARAKLPPTAKRLIDIGGSHGLYSAKFCEKHPGLDAVIFDWPQARQSAERTIKERGMADRMRFAEGDFFRDDIGKGFDAALLFNVLRIYPRNDAVTLLKKTREALAEGGKVFVADQFNTRTPTSFSRANAFLILLELYNGTSGNSFSATEAQAMLCEAGFARPREILLRRAPGISLVEASRGGVP